MECISWIIFPIEKQGLYNTFWVIMMLPNQNWNFPGRRSRLQKPGFIWTKFEGILCCVGKKIYQNPVLRLNIRKKPGMILLLFLESQKMSGMLRKLSCLAKRFLWNLLSR